MKNLILFGFKGAGKTHFGQKLSALLHCPFIDTDHMIQEIYKSQTDKTRTIREICKEIGEKKFRQLEKNTLPILEKIDRCVIALGGGFVLDPTNVEELQEIGTLVFLKASTEKLKKRIFEGELPTFLDPKDPEGSFYQMIHERMPIYESIKARKIDTDLLDEEGVIAELKAIWLLE